MDREASGGKSLPAGGGLPASNAEAAGPQDQGKPSLGSRAKQLVRRVLSNFVDYRLNWIVSQNEMAPSAGLPSSMEVAVPDHQHLLTFSQHPDGKVRRALSFERAGCRSFVLLEGSEPACLIHFADLPKYDSQTTWPLADDEVALVNVITLPAYRCRGFASILIAEATASLVPEYYKRAIAYIWWNHQTSLRAFKAAGWSQIGISIEISRRQGRWHSLHIPLRRQR